MIAGSPPKTFSGGWRSAMLAKILRLPSLLLLGEPTNH